MNGKLALVVILTFVSVSIALSFSGGWQNEYIASAPLGGSPTPTPSPGLSGTISYDNATGPPLPLPISGVTITCQGAQASVTAINFPNGDYWLDTSAIGPGPYIVTLSKTGGANGITAFDAARVAQFGRFPWDPGPMPTNLFIAANVTGTGQLSSFDSAAIAKYAVGLPNTSLTGTWAFVPASRTYESIDTHISGQDFAAILRGEVTGDWVNTLPRQ